MPDSGPVLIVSNHASYLDPICLGLASYHRPIHFMAKEELFKMPLLKQLLPRLYSFPVKRNSSDRQAMRTALDKLESGAVAAVFPQGTRVKEDALGAGQLGAALIAMKSGAAVLPAAISGSARVMRDGSFFPRFPRITVAFGSPFFVTEDGSDRKAVMATATEKMMVSIDELMAAAGG